MPIRKVLEGRVPVKMWASEMATVEEQAKVEKQLLNLATLPFVFKHVAAMPDTHVGIGATVGSVIATKGAIVPAAVGVDIGCGMMAVKLGINKNLVLDKIKGIRAAIETAVPVGFNGNQDVTETVKGWNGWNSRPTVADQVLVQKATHQLGSLGGGNHFIEIQLDKEDNVWVMLHSGSRNVGKTVAERHIEKAKAIMDAYFIKLADPDLAYLAEGTTQFDDYLYDLHWCQDYAMENRKEMMRRILMAIASFDSRGGVGKLMEVNCHHNYTDLENHFGSNVLVTRKGAVRARTGDLGIIPGSMGTGSFIVRGLGNPESFCSCSHGAGRAMSRTEAKKRFTTKDLAEQTSGVECRKDEGVLDEIPGAYKDINQVMKDQADLVEIVAELHQVMCIKG